MEHVISDPDSLTSMADKFVHNRGAVEILAFLVVLIAEVAYGIALTLGFFNITKFLIG